MSHERFPRRIDVAIWVAVLAFLGIALQEALAAPGDARVAWQRECGDCHVAYPPRLLTADDWRRIAATLERHYGVDASLEPATTAAIAGWLDANAGRPRGSRLTTVVAAGQQPLPRISTSSWFLREHDEIPAATWKRPAIGSAARCEACHTDAAQGRFSERAIRIPR